MTDMIRYRMLAIGLFLGIVVFRVLTLAVGALLMSALGLLIVQQYWLAMLVTTLAVLLYEGGYWFLVERWVR